MSYLLPLIVIAGWLPYWRRCRLLEQIDKPVPTARKAAFAAGLIVLAVAVSPLFEELSGELLSVHMIEHLLIGDIASLLLVLGVTGPLLAPILRLPVVGNLRAFANPAIALPLWAACFAVWHLPFIHEAAVRHDQVHALQHMFFLTLGIGLWMPLFGPLPKPPWFGNLARLGYIVVVRLIGALLGNIFVFGGQVFYPVYEEGASSHGVSALSDQIAAGSIMMVEGSVLTLGLFAWLFLKTASESQESQLLVEFAREQGIELSQRRAGRAVSAGRADELRARLSRQSTATDGD